MNYSGVDLNTQIALGNNTKNVQAIDCDVSVLYSSIDGHIHELPTDTKSGAVVQSTQNAILYTLETSNGLQIDATEYCKFLCNHDGKLEWFTLFDVPSSALIVTCHGSFTGTLKQKREGTAVNLKSNVNTYVANGFIVSNI